jgi:uncharacterized membrane protein
MNKRMLIALLALIGAFVAAYLTLFKLGIIGELTCTVGSCTTVQSSKWARLFGFPVAGWGLAFYITVFIVALVGSQPRFSESKVISYFLAAATGFGTLFSLWLTYLEGFVIRAWCQWCVVSAVIVTIIFVASILDLIEIVDDDPLDDSPSALA